MAGETVVAAEEHAEAAKADALQNAAATANTAAQTAVASAAVVAEHATELAAEHAEQLEERVAEHVAEQEDQLQWLRDHAKATTERLAEQSSALQTMSQRQEQTQTVLQNLAELLTPKPSQETPTAEPAAVAKNEATKESPEAPAQAARVQPKHRWI